MFKKKEEDHVYLKCSQVDKGIAQHLESVVLLKLR